MTEPFKDRVYNQLLAFAQYSYDLPKIIEFIDRYSSQEKKSCKILDVGCGYGKKLQPLQEAGYDVLGVDVNPQLIAANRAKGLNCLTVEEFEGYGEQFDLLLMSHIIEHFPPGELKEFMDSYLERLKMGGYLIIATPLLSDLFYEDFDHIKPYYPQGILMVFGDRYDDQVQYTSHHKLRLQDLWIRRRPYIPQFHKGRYMSRGTGQNKVFLVWVVALILLYRLSFRFIGQTDGWVGVFQKVKPIHK